MDFKFILFAILFCGAVFRLTRAEPTEDKRALLDFIKNIHHARKLNWKEQTSACSSWVGVTCNHDKSKIIAVRLPGIGMRGSISLNSLSRLSGLQILSLRSNRITGSFPSDFSKLKNLTMLYLQSNNFHGPLPDDFSVWKSLSVLNLSNNDFNGSIPSSMSNLTHLTALSLANNSLSGDIPDLDIPSLQLLNLSNNNLTGKVPSSLGRFPDSAFVGNHLSPLSSSPPVPSVLPPGAPPNKKSSKLLEPELLGIIIGGSALGFLVIAALLIICYSKGDENGAPAKPLKKDASVRKDASSSQSGRDNLIFFEGCNLAFDLEDLLRASAEILGKGTFGTTYKAALEDATTVVVKRLKDVSVGRKEFEQQMEVVGSIRHENLASLRAYYYSKDEKLMVYDFYIQGSISAMLHGKRGEGWIPLDWETRVRIAIGAARGIAYIHGQSGGKLVHGNIKSSNIFLNSEQYGCVSDLGLATLMSPMNRSAGYRPPEVTDSRKATQEWDVYGYGVLLLELLTRKSPTHATGGNEVVDLVRWVKSVVREEWTAEVFDIQLLKHPNIEEEMVEMLQIGMSCVARMPEKRPNISNVVKMVEGIRRVSTGTQPSTPTRSSSSYPHSYIVS